MHVKLENGCLKLLWIVNKLNLQAEDLQAVSGHVLVLYNLLFLPINLTQLILLILNQFQEKVVVPMPYFYNHFF